VVETIDVEEFLGVMARKVMQSGGSWGDDQIRWVMSSSTPSDGHHKVSITLNISRFHQGWLITDQEKDQTPPSGYP